MINMENDFYYMKQAISRAKAAAKVGEVPIGAVLVILASILIVLLGSKEEKQA